MTRFWGEVRTNVEVGSVGGLSPCREKAYEKEWSTHNYGQNRLERLGKAIKAKGTNGAQYERSRTECAVDSRCPANSDALIENA